MFDIKDINKFSTDRILDVATGDGSFIKFLMKYLNGFKEIIGIDLDEKVIGETKKSFNDERISFFKMSGEETVYLDESFDVVCISNSLHHLDDISKTLKEMKRVLKPEGIIVVNELICDEQNEKQRTHVYMHHLRGEAERLSGITHNNTFEKNEILRMINENQIDILHVHEHRNEMFDKYVKADIFAQTFKDIIENVKHHNEYADLKSRLDKYIIRLNDVGVEFATQLLIIGKKNDVHVI